MDISVRVRDISSYRTERRKRLRGVLKDVARRTLTCHERGELALVVGDRCYFCGFPIGGFPPEHVADMLLFFEAVTKGGPDPQTVIIQLRLARPGVDRGAAPTRGPVTTPAPAGRAPAVRDAAPWPRSTVTHATSECPEYARYPNCSGPPRQRRPRQELRAWRLRRPYERVERKGPGLIVRQRCVLTG
ncbi:hypothetical protein ACFWUW_19900 [Streptomyces sp. NPDC058655]|uniref:hypothetical protein n=1 Tax=Streptomyces sp. NPDC058655 TaxID=3346577 RepID=UPI003657ED30